MNYLSTLILFIITSGLLAQTNLLELKNDEVYDNVKIHQLYNNDLSTSFVIWVKKEVKPHKHEFHTENLYVLEGTAKMKLGNEYINIIPGDFLNIPKNTIHSVLVTSETPLKVISIQAPKFSGEDRIYIE